MINILKKLTLTLWLTVLAVCFIGVTQVSAATITVSTTNDEYGSGNECSVREAIEVANNKTGSFGGCDITAGAYGDSSYTINIPADTNPYIISIFPISFDPDDNTDGDLDIGSSIRFQGDATNPPTISGGGSYRVFHIIDVSTDITVEFDDLIINNGGSAEGQGIYIEAEDNNGNVTVNITNSNIANNEHEGVINGTADGGISTVNITNSIISGNGSLAGVRNYSSNGSIATINITNSDISGHTSGSGIRNFSSTDGLIDSIPGTSIVTIVDGSNITGNNTPSAGGGIENICEYQSICEVYVVNSTISGNHADSYGGGIYNYAYSTFGGGYALLDISDSSIISGNTSNVPGGGIYNESYGDSNNVGGDTTIVNITDSIISGNTAAGGGGIYNYSEYDNVSNKITITNSTINNNTADGTSVAGGGIASYVYGETTGTIKLTNSTVSGNSADFGDGIYIQTDGLNAVSTTTLINSTINDNVNSEGGDGIYLYSNAVDDSTINILNIENSTISENDSYGIRATRDTNNGIVEINIDSATIAYHSVNNIELFWGATANIKNTILYQDDDPANTNNCYIDTNNNSTLISQGNNLENGNTCGFTSTGDITSANTADPNPLLQPLALNGPGNTATHALTWDSDPANSSPAIDAGATTLSEDQRGVSRSYGTGPDIGAYEYMTGSLTIIKLVDNLDGAGYASPGDFSLLITPMFVQVSDIPVNSGEKKDSLSPGLYAFDEEDPGPDYYPTFTGPEYCTPDTSGNFGVVEVVSGEDRVCYVVNTYDDGNEPIPTEYLIITKAILGENAPDDPSAFSVNVNGTDLNGTPITDLEIQFPQDGIIFVPIQPNSNYEVTEPNVDGYTPELSDSCTRGIELGPAVVVPPAICNITNTYTPPTIPPPSTPPPSTPPAGGGPTITTPPAGGTITPPSQCLNYLHADNSYLPSRDLEFLDLSTADPSYRAYINALKSSYILPESFNGLDPLPEIKQLPADPTLRFVISGYLAGSTDNTSYVGPKNILKRLEWAKILMVSHCLPIFDTTNQNVDYLGNPLGVWNDLPRVYTGNLDTDYPLHIAYSANYYGIWDGYWNITTQKFDTIGLQNDVTYAQAVKMLVGLRELLANTSSPTVDATSGDWWTTFYNVSGTNSYTTSSFLQAVKATLGVPREEGIYETVLSQLAADIYTATDSVLVEEYIDSPEAAAL
jgi:hypothetical protein